jgi:hypothetical protein
MVKSAQQRTIKNNGIDLAKISSKEIRNSLIYVDGNKTSDPNHIPLSIPQLAKKYGVNYRTAQKWKNCNGQTHRKKRVKRNTKMTCKIKDFIKQQAGNKLTTIGRASPNILVKKVIKKFGEEYKKDVLKKIGDEYITVTKEFSISNTCIRNHLNKILTKAKKIKKSFKLTENNVNSRKNFCDWINENSKDYKDIFFTDEKIFELEKGFHRGTNYIRLTKESKLKLDRGDPEMEKLVSISAPKFSKSFMVAGVITKYGPGKLIFISGNQDSKAYEMILNYYKEDIDYINNLKQCNLLLQQDNAPTHTSGDSMKIIEDLFYKKPDITEELKISKPGKYEEKGSKTKESIQAKIQYKELQSKYDDAQIRIKEKLKELNPSQHFLLKSWPPNSPVIYFKLKFRI